MKAFREILEFIIFEHKNIQLTVLGLFIIIFIFLVDRLGLWALNKALNRSFSKKAISDPGRRHALMQIARYLIYTFAIAFSLENIGVDLDLVLTGSAALLVGVGFGLQHTFNDFFSGVIILFDGSIEVGDVVQVGELIGRIKRIGIRATTIHTRESFTVIVPNSKFTQENVINWSHNNEVTRFQVNVGVAYGSDVELVMRLMNDVAKAHPKISKTPAPVVRFADFADSALLFEVFFWTHDSFNVEFIKSDIRIKIDAEFRQHNVKIPFPQRDLHIISDQR